DVVWNKEKQTGLIDSILRCYYIPPVIFAVQNLDDGSQKRTCIDGKQRLTSIHSFTGTMYFYRDNPARKTKPKKKLLPESLRRQFDCRGLLCVEYQDIEGSQEREIFRRVQLGMALSTSEKLAVIDSPREQFIRDLLEKYLNGPDAGLSSDVLSWHRERGSDFGCLAQTVHTIAIFPNNPSTDATAKWLEDKSPVTPALTADVEQTYRIFAALVRDPRNGAHFEKIAPVEFVVIGILVNRHSRKLSLEDMGKAVGELRQHLRKRHQDMRNNSTVLTTALTFI
ncbi:hypothetical protein R3P38DRAFT_2416235, partial [Favolaschia claudopus]